MPSKLRQKIREKLFKNQPDDIQTPISPFVLPPQTRVYIIVLPIVLWAIALLLWAQTDIDRLILISHNAMRSIESLVNVLRLISKNGMALIIFVLLIHLVLSQKVKVLKNNHTVFLLTIFSFGLSGIAGDVMKEIFDRARPFITYADQITAITHPKTPSFPSGHATKSMALALPFFVVAIHPFWWHRLLRWSVLLAALAVGYARIALGAHYLSDVLAGIGVAIAGLPIAMHFANKITGRLSQERLGTIVKVWGTILFFLMIYMMAYA